MNGFLENVSGFREKASRTDEQTDRHERSRRWGGDLIETMMKFAENFLPMTPTKCQFLIFLKNKHAILGLSTYLDLSQITFNFLFLRGLRGIRGD